MHVLASYPCPNSFSTSGQSVAELKFDSSTQRSTDSTTVVVPADSEPQNIFNMLRVKLK
jgi:hypothetical protein